VIVVVPGSPAAAAGLRVGDRIDKVDGKAPRGVTGVIAVPRDKNGDFPSQVILVVKRPGVRKPILLTIGRGEVTLVSVPTGSVLPNRTLPGRIAYLEVPGIVGDANAQTAYATQLQMAIRAEDGDARCGWVVDLRRNRGGYIYAMLAGLGPLAGDGLLGGQLAADGKVTAWTYSGGTLRVGDQPTVSVADPYVLRHRDAPVAVLTTGLTASAGEASTIAFAQRPNTRRFGEATLGLTTFNIQRTMPDAAVLVVTNAVDIDRAANPYDGPIQPDVSITTDWTHVGDDADPVLNAAVQWLATTAACTVPG
jgi:carboxyl-terminal processing protease